MGSGKTVAGRRYLHQTLLDRAEPELTTGVAAALEMLRASVEPDFNVVRVAADGSEVAFLNYPDFFEQPFPALKESWRVDCATGETGYRTYEDSLNPPILHRKELLLPGDDPGRAEYLALTEQAESIGLTIPSASVIGVSGRRCSRMPGTGSRGIRWFRAGAHRRPGGLFRASAVQSAGRLQASGCGIAARHQGVLR